MKRMFLLVWAITLCALTSYAQQANIYASGLKAEKISAVRYAFTYTLNADAEGIGIHVFNADNTVRTSNFPQSAEYKTKGAHTVELDLDLPDGDYLWSVYAFADANTAPVKVSNDAGHLGFHALRGLAVDNSFESPFFGRIYATEGNETTAAAAIRTTNDGIYIYNAALEDVTNQGNAAYTSGVTWGLSGVNNSGASPFRVSVAPDGKVFVTDWSDTHSGIWTLDPANPSADLQPVFGGTRNSAGVGIENDVQIHGSISHCYIEGTGADAKLYTFDEDLGLASGVSGNVYRYDIGVLENPWAVAPSALVYDDAANGNLQQNGNSSIAPDGRGGWWICQYRATDSNPAIPSLIHYNGTNIDFVSATDASDPESTTTPPSSILRDSYQGGMALSEDKSLMVVSGNNTVRILDVTFDETTGKPAIALKYTIPTTYGTNSFSVALDRANNVYVGGNASAFSVWALPKADNSFSTPAPASQKVQIGGTGVKTPDQGDRIRIANGNGNIRLLTDGTKIKGYTLYDVSGTKILNGAAATGDVEISTSRLNAGVYLIQITTEEGTTVKRFIKK